MLRKKIQYVFLKSCDGNSNPRQGKHCQRGVAKPGAAPAGVRVEGNEFVFERDGEDY